MRPDELVKLLRIRPFSPLRIHVTGGQTYDITHPECVIVLRGRVDIGLGGDPETGPVERVEHVSLLHIVRVEELQVARPPSSENGTPSSGN